MKPFFFGICDWWGRWSIDRAGALEGSYTLAQLREMLDAGTVNAHTWLRHRWTQRFSLVGEVLYSHDLANQAEFDAWFPRPERIDLPMGIAG